LYGNRQSTKPRPKYFFALEVGAGIVHIIHGEELARELEGIWRRNKSKTFVKTGFGIVVMPIVVPLDEWKIMLPDNYKRVKSHGCNYTLMPKSKLFDKVIYTVVEGEKQEEPERDLKDFVLSRRAQTGKEQFQILSSPLVLDRLLELSGVELDDHRKQQFRQAWVQTLTQLVGEEN